MNTDWSMAFVNGVVLAGIVAVIIGMIAVFSKRKR